MFDDQPSSSAMNTPPNLPLGEPQDIFESTESSLPGIPTDTQPGSGSALEAGILKPKIASPLEPNLPQVEVPPASIMPNESTLSEPKAGRGLMVIIVSIIIGVVLVGALWFAYRIFMTQSAESESQNPVSKEVEIPTKEPEPIKPVVTTTPVETPTSTEGLNISSSSAIDQEILFGQTRDTDGDGLKDANEKELNTDPNKKDTDDDGLDDGAEFLIWHTNPKNPDTDGDTYKDGQEIEAGYNPNGPGKLSLTAPTSTPVAEKSPSTSFGINKLVVPTSTTSSFEIEL